MYLLAYKWSFGLGSHLTWALFKCKCVMFIKTGSCKHGRVINDSNHIPKTEFKKREEL